MRVGLGTDLGAGTSFSILLTLHNEAYKAAQLNNYALQTGTRLFGDTGPIECHYIDDKVGSIVPGMEA